MARTVGDVLARHNGNGVLAFRHGRYENRHVVAACGGDIFEMYAQNYSRKVPDSFFPLNARGYEESVSQGRRLKEVMVFPERIITSANGRGPHTAIAIADGIAQANGVDFLPSVHHDARVDYPVYNYQGLTDLIRSLEQQHGSSGSNRMVAEWLNSKRPQQCIETPEMYGERCESLVIDLLQRPGLSVVVGHFELIVLLHSLLVAEERPGNITENWWPAYNQGVLIVPGRMVGPMRGVGPSMFARKMEAFDVAPDLTIIE